MQTDLKSLYPPNRQPVYTVAISPNDDQLIVGQQSDEAGNAYLSLWDLASLQMRYPLESGEGHINSPVRYSSDGKCLAYADESLRVCFYNLEERVKYRPEVDARYVQWLRYAQQTDRLVVAGLQTQVWDARHKVIWTLPAAATWEHDVPAPAIADLSPNGAQVAVAGAEAGQIVIYDIDHGDVVQRLSQAPDYARWVSFDSSGDYLAVIERHSHGVFLWHLASGEQFLPHIFNSETQYYWSLCFHPDSTFLALGNLNGVIRLYRLSDGELVFRQRVHEGRVWDMAFTSDGRCLISGGDDGVVGILAFGWG